MMKNSLYLLPLMFLSCDRAGDDLVPSPNGEFDSVIEIGELGLMSTADKDNFQAAILSGERPAQWCKDNTDSNGNPLCYYGILGQSENGVKGGATLTFRGDGGPVCVIVDPESVFWNTAVAEDRPESMYRYPDYEEDDGDIDLFAGLSSYYMGSPGIEIGDFSGFYTDSLGSEIEIEYGECIQVSQYGLNNAHAGRATPEYCTISTNNREGVEYTAVLESFSVPLDDGALGFGVAVVQGACTDMEINECTLRGESQKADRDASNAVIRGDDGDIQPYTRACTRQLESASCNDTLREFCCVYPDMCGEDPKEYTCVGVELSAADICADGHELNYLCCNAMSTE